MAHAISSAAGPNRSTSPSTTNDMATPNTSSNTTYVPRMAPKDSTPNEKSAQASAVISTQLTAVRVSE